MTSTSNSTDSGNATQNEAAFEWGLSPSSKLTCPDCGRLGDPLGGGLALCTYPDCESPGDVFKVQRTTILEEQQPDPIEDHYAPQDEVTGALADGEMCGECGCKEVVYRLKQLRSADEPETRLFTCTDCGHTWRHDSAQKRIDPDEWSSHEANNEGF